MPLPKRVRLLVNAVHALLAAALAVLGGFTLFSPDVPPSALAENTAVAVTLVTTAALLVVAVFRPRIGGWLLLVGALAFAIAFNGFHLSEFIWPSRTVGYSVFWSGTTATLLLLGLVSLLRDG